MVETIAVLGESERHNCESGDVGDSGRADPILNQRKMVAGKLGQTKSGGAGMPTYCMHRWSHTYANLNSTERIL